MRLSLTFVSAFILAAAYGQNTSTAITKSVTKNETRALVEFLAADEMRGRATGSTELEIAANFITTWWKKNNLQPVGGAWDQKVPFSLTTPPDQGNLKIGNQEFRLNAEMVLCNGADSDLTSELVFVGYGTEDDFRNIDVKNKIAVALIGYKDQADLGKAIRSDSPAKNKLARAAGAVAVIELMNHPGIPFSALVNYFSRPRFQLATGAIGITHVLLKSPGEEFIASLKASPGKATLKISGTKNEKTTSRNVLAMVEGTDPVLKKQFIVVTAHYDHVGVGAKNAAGDSIFNGARDNALGTVALLSAGKYLANNRPKRSVLFIALTAEERGLLGSEWYSENPVIPLRDCVFNLNTDGAGYNDTTSVTINGFEFTATKSLVAKACAPFATAKEDPIPEQDLYSRSDNYNFASKGIPSINMAPGFTGFDAELRKYYHQQNDEAGTIDYDYTLKYFRAFCATAEALANAPVIPGWLPGTKYEPLGKALYR